MSQCRGSITLHRAALLSAAVGIILYLNTMDCGFVYDDEPGIKWNKDLRPQTPWSNLLKNDFWGSQLTNPTSHKSYRPLCVATFRLNYMLHELQPMGYHLVNVLLHGFVCYLYVQLCGVIFSEVWPALIAGLLFAVHPIHTEAIAGLVGRAEPLSGIFYLCSFLAYHRGITTRTKGMLSIVWLLLSVFLSGCSMFSKEQGITVVAVSLAYDFFVVNKLGSILNSDKSKLKTSEFKESDSESEEFTPSFKESTLQSTSSKSLTKFFKRSLLVGMCTLIMLTVRLWVAHGVPSSTVFDMVVNPPLSQDVPYRQLSWLYLIFVNSWLLLSPSRLCADWRFGAVPLIKAIMDPNNLLTVVTVALVVLLTTYGLSGHEKKNKVVLSGVFLTVFPFIPASNMFFPVGFVVAERVLYLPSMGFCLLVGYSTWLLLQYTTKYRPLHQIIRILIGYLLVTHSLKTLYRNRDWYDSPSINTAGMKVNPHNAVLMSNLGIDYAIMREYTKAEQLYTTCIRLSPTYHLPYFNLGKLLKVTHRYQEAESPLIKAIELGSSVAPKNKMSDAYHLLSSVIATNASRLPEALSMCNEGLHLFPSGKLLTTKCNILFKLNKTREAIDTCRTAIRMNPGLANAHYTLGLAHMMLGHQAEAEKAFRDTLLIEKSTVAMFHLATVLQRSGSKQDLLEARELWHQVVSFEPNNIEALLNLAYVHFESSNYHHALQALQRILHLLPDHKDALYKTAVIYYKIGSYEEAVVMAERLAHLDPGYMNVNSLLHSARTLAKQKTNS